MSEDNQGGETMSGEPRKSQIPTMQLDYGTELFVDDLLIENKRGVKRTLHPGTKLEKPVLTPERPWEQGGATSPGGLTYKARLI